MDFFDKIDSHISDKLPVVVYRKPNEGSLKAILQKDDQLIHLKDYSETGFVFAPFDADHPAILLRNDEQIRLENYSLPNSNTSKHNVIEIQDDQKEFHIHLIEKAISRIKTGDFKKVVLSRRLKIGWNTQPLEFFKKLLATYANAFCYLWYHPKVGTWIGATPEILLTTQNRTLTTMSLAGTQAYTGNDSPAWGNKELEEQELVTEFIMEALEDKVSNLNGTPTQTIRAGNLMHLRTKISGLMDNQSLEPIVQALHPTPAVCGMPKMSSKDFILNYENYDREFYTGFLGELNFVAERHRITLSRNQESMAYRSIAKSSTFYVNLRCIQIVDREAFVYVGGGITKDSDPEKEWEETVAKSKTMLEVLMNT